MRRRSRAVGPSGGSCTDAGGQAYNLSSQGEITQHQMLDALTDALGLARINRHIPFRLAFWIAAIAMAILR